MNKSTKGGSSAETVFLEALATGSEDAPRLADAAFDAGSRQIDVLRSWVTVRRKEGQIVDLMPYEKVLSRTQSFRRIYAELRSELQLLRHGYAMPDRRHRETLFGLTPHRAFYLLHHSLPYDTSGYAMRSHFLLDNLSRTEWQATGVTRAGYPDIAGGFPEFEAVSGVNYLRSAAPSGGLFQQPIVPYLGSNIQAMVPRVRQYRPSVIHAASNYVNGVAAAFLGKRFDLPSVYEVRGLWELTRASRDVNYHRSDLYAMQARMETEVCLNVDHVFALTRGLRDILVDRGVPSEKIEILPNGVDTQSFRPAPPDQSICRELGISSRDVIVGYIGSVVDYEGLDDLMLAIFHLHRLGFRNTKLLVAGNGPALPALKAQAKALGLRDAVIFAGQREAAEVVALYRLIDIAPFPRKPWPVTEIVSPMKPFEAMAMETCVLVSGVEALRDIVQDGQTGMIFEKGNLDHLVSQLAELVANEALRRSLAAKARQWVIANHDWQGLAQRVAERWSDLSARHMPR